MYTFNKKVRTNLGSFFDRLNEEEDFIRQVKQMADRRYLLVATTEELIEMGLLKHEDGGVLNPRKLPRAKRIRFDPKNLKKNRCQVINYHDDHIPILEDYNHLTKKGVLRTPHGYKDARRFIRTPKAGLTHLKIFDKEAFWSESIFIVIEI